MEGQLFRRNQKAMAAPSGPQVSGFMMQALDEIPRSIHCFRAPFKLIPLPT